MKAVAARCSGIDVGEAETEAFWREFLDSLRARGLAGVALAVSDAHGGLKAAIAKVLGCPWQRCTVHFLRDMLGHVGKDQQPMIAGAIRQIFGAESRAEASAIGRCTHAGPAPEVARDAGVRHVTFAAATDSRNNEPCSLVAPPSGRHQSGRLKAPPSFA